MKKLLLALCVPFCLSGNAAAQNNAADIEELKAQLSAFAKLAYEQKPTEETALAITEFHIIGGGIDMRRRRARKAIQEKFFKGMKTFCPTGIRTLHVNSLKIRKSQNGDGHATAYWKVECKDGKKFSPEVIKLEEGLASMPITWVKSSGQPWNIPLWNIPSLIVTEFANVAFVDKDYRRALEMARGSNKWSEEEWKKNLDILENWVEDNYEHMLIYYDCKSPGIAVPLGQAFDSWHSKAGKMAVGLTGCLVGVRQTPYEINLDILYDEGGLVDWKKMTTPKSK